MRSVFTPATCLSCGKSYVALSPVIYPTLCNACRPHGDRWLDVALCELLFGYVWVTGTYRDLDGNVQRRNWLMSKKLAAEKVNVTHKGNIVPGRDPDGADSYTYVPHLSSDWDEGHMVLGYALAHGWEISTRVKGGDSGPPLVCVDVGVREWSLIGHSQPALPDQHAQANQALYLLCVAVLETARAERKREEGM